MGSASQYWKDNDTFSVITCTEDVPEIDGDNMTDNRARALRLNCMAQDRKSKTSFSMTLVLSEERDSVSYLGSMEHALSCLVDLKDQALLNAVANAIERIRGFMQDRKHKDRLYVFRADVQFGDKKDEIGKIVQADIADFRHEFQESLLKIYNGMMGIVEKNHTKPPPSPLVRMRRILSWQSDKLDGVFAFPHFGDPGPDADTRVPVTSPR